MPMFPKVSTTAEGRSNERGAALITMLMVSLLLLVAGGALIMTTALSATNAIDSTAETQAYYAAEAGMQATLNVLRGNVAPNPLFNTSSANAPENKITFRQALSSPTLSRWLSYSNTYSAARVPISANYTPFSGMAYNVSVSDPDNMGTAIFSVTGVFTSSNLSSLTVGNSNQTRVTITYSPPSTNPATITSSGTASFGSFQITPSNAAQFNSFDIGTLTGAKIDFNLTISQTAPYPSTPALPTTVVIPCTLTGVISSTLSQNTVRLSIVPPSLNPTSTANNIGGVSYARTTNFFPLTYNATTAISPVTVTSPAPRRLLVKVAGYGPRAAEKHLQMMVSRFALDYTPNAAITLRSADSGAPMTMFAVGNSAQYGYTGYDYSGGGGLPAFAVTNDADLTLVNTTLTGNTQVTGTSPALKLPIPSLATFLQTAQRARDAVALLKEMAKNEYWPIGTTGDANDRYFPAGTTPNTFGTETEPLITFVDGDAQLPPGGGAGMLVVTGILDMRGNADFKGLVFVLGTGKVLRNGGGNGSTLGAMVVASFGATGDFTSPYYDSNGTGTAGLSYDSQWTERALMGAGPSVRGVSEY